MVLTSACTLSVSNCCFTGNGGEPLHHQNRVPKICLDGFLQI